MDGFGAAFSALHFGRQTNSEIEAIPVSHGDLPDLEKLRGKNVLVADFSFKKVTR